MQQIQYIFDIIAHYLKAVFLKAQLTGLLHVFFSNNWRPLVLANVKSGKIVYANDSFLEAVGWDIKKFKDKPFIDFVCEDDKEKTLAEMEHLKRGGHTSYFTNRYRKPDGSLIRVTWVSFVAYGWYFAEAKFNE